MKPDKLKALILSLTRDVTFTYNGKYACINPFSSSKFEVSFDNVGKDYTDIDALMSDKFYDGKTLIEICEIAEFD